MIRQFALTSAAAAFLAACTHYNNIEPKESASLPVKADVTIAEDGAGGYSFTYKAPFADEKGNFDFSQKGAAFNTIKLTFTIADGSVSGIKFKPDATDAIWIVEKKNVDEATGSPRGPYRGNQFSDFTVSADGQSLTVMNQNNDSVLYRYGLRFDLDGKTVIDDPDTQNGPPH
ncbi:MAG: hypothetical protein AB7F91_05695 [Parvularculaceae bacterium]